MVYSNIGQQIKHLLLTGFQSIGIISHDDIIMFSPTLTFRLDDFSIFSILVFLDAFFWKPYKH